MAPRTPDTNAHDCLAACRKPPEARFPGGALMLGIFQKPNAFL